jgi:hypothetical protein
VLAIVSDNGSDIRAATQEPSVFGVRLYCLCHGLNSTIQNALGLWKKEKEEEKEKDPSTNLIR